jgi:class 3 adenylate cyclase/tetratricopeptide (TPR) repeat protein
MAWRVPRTDAFRQGGVVVHRVKGSDLDGIQKARAALASGNLIAAYDEAQSALDPGAQVTEARYLQTLALARMGHIERATALFNAYELGASSVIDHQSLGARLAKDRALALPKGASRRQALEDAAAAYQAIYNVSADPYPGVNAATLLLLAGHEDAARALASQILVDPAVTTPDNFYLGATQAECLLLLDEIDMAAAALARAATMPGFAPGTASTTCRQLELVGTSMGLARSRIDLALRTIRPGNVMHFCGHIFASDPLLEGAIRSRVDVILEQQRIDCAYGALAAGADIIVAEAVLARGGELQVILPFGIDDFIAQSVRPAGEAWVDRFHRCYTAATDRRYASEMPFIGDPRQFGYGSRVAMGLAVLRAQHLGSQVLQLALSNDALKSGAAGTAADVLAWQKHGRPTITLAPGDVDRDWPRAVFTGTANAERALVAMLFTDFPGFSKLSEAILPLFWEGIMGGIADVLDGHRREVLSSNTWGDALYAVMSSAAGAAQIALALQERLRAFDYGSLGMENCGGMRIGVHFGAVFETIDRITGNPNFYGTEVSRAARIEPVTPPGEVFVTEPFAAILALEAPDQFICSYVGRVELAKNYGTYPMYLLKAAMPRAGR